MGTGRGAGDDRKKKKGFRVSPGVEGEKRQTHPRECWESIRSFLQEGAAPEALDQHVLCS